jgi:hypothetical protein
VSIFKNKKTAQICVSAGPATLIVSEANISSAFGATLIVSEANISSAFGATLIAPYREHL